MKSFRFSYGFIALLLIVLVGVGCQNDGTETKDPVTPPPPPKTQYKVPAFNGDSAMVYIAKQIDFGPRVPNSAAHTACKDWMAGQLRAFGWSVIEQDFKTKKFDGTIFNATNVIGQYNPKAKNRIFLAAHWDSRFHADSPLATERQDEPILGADDGASGVGILLELARVMEANPIAGKDLGVDIVFFDVEDQGDSDTQDSWCLGAQYWAANLHAPGYRPKYGILLDMVGSKHPRFTKDRVSMAYAPTVMNRVWSLAQSMGHGGMFVNIPTDALIDDHLYVNQIAGLPMIDIINRPAGSQTGFGHYWHTHEDDLDIIHQPTVQAVGQVMTAVVYREASGNF
ncbi:MAG: M28 family peptidase [Bacteroidota bacterium]